ncbi:MAG: Gfo/Idh/MocA family protein [Vicinamibacterales bacterium]
MSSPVSRRHFLVGVAGAAVLGPFAGRRLPAQARKIRHASVGAAGQALSDLRAFSSHPGFSLVAVADVDLARTAQVKKFFPDARIYQDWREMFRKEEQNIDSVNISTPDHMHAAIAMSAMTMGKPVYVQKPLALTVRETRVLAHYARTRSLVTQMGIQISSHETQLVTEQLIRDGAVGKIREVHTFCNKTWGDPNPIPEGSDPVPETLDWDGWIGVGEPRPYKANVYHPGNWRKRVGYGTGTLGDMGCHIFSTPLRGLGLALPRQVTSHGPAAAHGNWPINSKIHFAFDGTPSTAGDTLDFWWYDGAERPPQQVIDAVGGKLPSSGAIMIGTEGAILLPHIDYPTLHPQERFLDREITKGVSRNHYHEFLDAVVSGPGTRCSANLDYAALLTEVVLLGTIACYHPGETLEYDVSAMRFDGRRDPKGFSRKYREEYLGV